ncbi:MAG: hypothetical protein COT74_03545 [Bdellovibrionales bacterium CG10_big_fil_rev_8_21_14_0_10_45_34]|nr:MAG: hypothetical protein COT74_03545 [Bdellovibrionales bacterium CG10_big_fil_rev_8_21_14_0_10_45_34]
MSRNGQSQTLFIGIVAFWSQKKIFRHLGVFWSKSYWLKDGSQASICRLAWSLSEVGRHNPVIAVKIWADTRNWNSQVGLFARVQLGF